MQHFTTRDVGKLLDEYVLPCKRASEATQKLIIDQLVTVSDSNSLYHKIIKNPVNFFIFLLNCNLFIFYLNLINNMNQ